MESKNLKKDCPMERELSEKEIVELLKHVPGGIAMYEFRDGEIFTKYYSDGMERLTGFPREEREQISGREGYLRIHEEDRKGVIATIEASVAQGKSFDIVYRFRRKDESYIWVRVTVNMVAMEEEDRFSFYVIFTDLNEFKEQEVLLKKQEEQLRVQQRRNELCQKEFGIEIWEYDIEKKEHIIDESCGFWYEILKENHSLDIMTENSRKKYQRMLLELETGVESTSTDVEICVSGISSWYHIQYLTIFSEENHLPVRAIGMSKRLEEYREYELKYQKEVLKSNRLDINGLASYRANLTRNLVEEGVILKPGFDGFTHAESACEFFEELKDCVKDIMQIRELDKLLYQMEHNYIQLEKKNYQFEYCGKMPDRIPSWVRANVSILKRPVSEDMIAFIYLSDISREKYEKLVMDKVVGTDYDYLALVVVEHEKWGVMQKSEQAREESWERVIPYREALEKRVERIVPEEREAAMAQMELSTIKEELEKKNIYSCSHYYNEAEWTVCRKKWMFSYLDEKKDILLVRRSDITGMYQQHEEQNKKLKEALQKAEEASAAKSRFLSNMSHDMRTPMNAIIGFSDETLTREEDAEGLRKMLLQVNTSGKYLLSLINNVLDMSWIESRKLVLNLEPVRLGQVFEEIRLLVLPQMEKKHIDFVMEERGDEKEFLMCDKVYIRQVLMNILSNAIKFTPDFGRIECIGESTLRGDGFVEKQIRIKDSGIGMSEEFLPKIFESFEQENDADKSTYTGTGLGMAIVKGIIDLMGGTIDVKSKKGEGTEFTIRVKLSCCEKEGQDISGGSRGKVSNEEGHGESSIQEIPDFSEKRVLLCEDHPINKLVAEKMLAKVNCQMEYAENGKIGTELFAASKPGYYDLILMDIQMPQMNGIEAAKAIRAMNHPDAGTIPIVAMTANAFTEDIERSKAAGMNRHIGKPVQPKELYKVMEECLK